MSSTVLKELCLGGNNQLNVSSPLLVFCGLHGHQPVQQGRWTPRRRFSRLEHSSLTWNVWHQNGSLCSICRASIISTLYIPLCYYAEHTQKNCSIHSIWIQCSGMLLLVNDTPRENPHPTLKTPTNEALQLAMSHTDVVEGDHIFTHSYIQRFAD